MLLFFAACTSSAPSTPATPAATPTPPSTPVVGTAPSLEVRFPPSGAVDAMSVPVFGRASDPEGPVAIEVVGPLGTLQTAPDADGRFRVDGLELTPGTTTLTVAATDSDGNRTETTVELETGPTLLRPLTFQVDADGTVLWVDTTGTARIDPVTGERSRYSSNTGIRRSVRLGDTIYLQGADTLFRAEASAMVPVLEDQRIDSLVAEPQGTLLLMDNYDALLRWDPGSTAPPVQLFSTNEAFGLLGSDGLTAIAFEGVDLVSLDLQTGTSTPLVSALSFTSAVWLDPHLWFVDRESSTLQRLHVEDLVFEDLGPMPLFSTLLADGNGVLLADEWGAVHRIDAQGTSSPVVDPTRAGGPKLPGCSNAGWDPVRDRLLALCYQGSDAELWAVQLPSGERSLLGPLPEDTAHARYEPVSDRTLVLARDGRLAWVDGAGVTLITGPTPEWFIRLQTDGTSAWSAVFCDYCESSRGVEFDLATGVRTELPTGGEQVVYDPAGPRFLFGGRDRIDVWEPATDTRALLYQTPTGGWLHELNAIRPGWLFAHDRYDRDALLLDTETGAATEKTLSEPWPFFPNNLAASDGEVLYGVQFRATAVDPETGTVVVFSR